MILILFQVRYIFQRWISDICIRDDIIYEHRHLLSLYVTVMLYVGYQFFLVFFLHFVQKLSFVDRILSEREDSEGRSCLADPSNEGILDAMPFLIWSTYPKHDPVLE